MASLTFCESATVIVTFVDDLPISVGNGSDASAPTAQIAPHDVPGAQLVADLGYLGAAVYRSTGLSEDADALCDLIMLYANVETCEPDSTSTIDQTAFPNDPAYGRQRYLNTTNTVALWQEGIFGNKNVKIGVIDTGVDLSNPDIAASLWTNPDVSSDEVPGALHCASFLQGKASGDCQDGNNHGTFVAGMIGAASNNMMSISGAVQLPTLLPCQYMDATGNGQISDALMCFNWLASKGVQVISCSWGSTSASTALQQAVSKLSMAGIFISTSAGNNGISTDTSPQYPSAYSSTLSAVVSVAAVDDTGSALWPRSNYGNSTVQLAAPGVNIIGLGTNGTIINESGTSMLSTSPFSSLYSLPLPHQ